jgi:predicted transcriptional regulator
VRDFFHYCDNYIDSIDHVAERYAAQAGFQTSQPLNAAAAWLRDKYKITTVSGQDHLRSFDPETRVLTLSSNANTSTRLFQIAHQSALIAHNDLLDATLDFANFRTKEARAICKIGLANYFAGAAVMPYQRFLQAAQDCRHDLEQLSQTFGSSIEQVAHRLSTLQRPGLKGIPFFFVRVDQAGTITKRHSATSLQFARYGGACPLWNVHRAFETPRQFLRQLAQTADGQKYFCLARDVSKSGGAFNAPTRRYAIGLGCEVRHLGDLVYGDDLDAENNHAFEPIGISCRICERRNCHQRSVPPLERALNIDHNYHGVLPYGIDE